VQITARAQDGFERFCNAAEQGAPFHLAVVDRLMPEVDEIKLAEMIRADDAVCGARLVLLTSLNEDLPRAERERLQLTCLQKPVRQSVLFDTLITVAGRGAARGKQPEPAVASQTAPAPASEHVATGDRIAPRRGLRVRR
jgi:CheY-like chemotaxis protein